MKSIPYKINYFNKYYIEKIFECDAVLLLTGGIQND